ncbi:hypothetical protein [Roseiconus lacunae]|uniref:DUF7605 domain-containing protein n=1 Tax=Roseiconus lacunae TaxID=2605694 RepID=A0ABT7PHG9_9BACT|nr:hypothetical protein [Roseiconus lacunae]MDM4015937.1 hypothetical protein [Roseiconus lacunae]
MVDLPGTNDTDAQRTLVTNSVRDSATAVAVVTSDSNLGPDIESWLRHSSVLANFLEATNQRRQRLFIIRTKLDSYHPEISDEECRDLTEAEEAELFWKAVENYKDEQTQTYRAMLRDIASPKLPHGEDEASRAKRTELLSRIDEIPVYFVSALAHEVFTGRYQASRRTRNQLSEYFDEEIEKTGVPGLNAAFQNVAAEYLAANFYDDLELQLEQEARLLAGTFQRAITSLKAELAGGRDALQNTVSRVRGELIPWLRSEVDELENRFREKFAVGANGIHDRLRHADAMSVRRFDDKLRLWSNYHWASLRAAGRKKGSHMTSRGDCIDFAEDICSVLVDDVTVAWTHFRDDLIANEIESVTSRLVDGLQIKLAEYEQLSEQDEVRLAINQIAKQLSGITHQQRLQLLQLVNEKIREVESIRRPAYEIAQDEFAPIYRGISIEMGTGCAARIRQRLESEVPAAIDRIRRRVFELVSSSVSNLGDGCAGELGAFGDFATDRIEATVTHISTELIDRDETILNARIDTANAALKLLPANLETA